MPQMECWKLLLPKVPSHTYMYVQLMQRQPSSNKVPIAMFATPGAPTGGKALPSQKPPLLGPWKEKNLDLLCYVLGIEFEA